MSYRLLLDENVEREVAVRLRNRDHDVKCVANVEALGKGVSDEALAAYSVETDRTIVSYDDDFVRQIPPSEYRGVIFFEDETISPDEVATIIHEISEVYPHHRVTGLQKAGREWL